jgi:hypothetical protein
MAGALRGYVVDWKYVWIGLAAGAVLGYMRVGKGGGRTPATPGAFGPATGYA